jgi:predicted transcriptional regulator
MRTRYLPSDILRRMNWSAIIKDLNSRGWTQALISERTGIAQSAISEMLNGKRSNPRFVAGQALLDLHRSGKKHTPAKAAA